MINQNKIWIEFDNPTPEAIKLMNKMLDRLDAEMYFLNNEQGDLLVSSKKGGGYQKCPDHGSWFNLDHLGRED